MQAYLHHGSASNPPMSTELVEVINAPLWYHDKGLMQTATGYGRKLKTPYKVRWNNRAYRVYSICFSNVSTEYIISNKQQIIVRLEND